MNTILPTQPGQVITATGDADMNDLLRKWNGAMVAQPETTRLEEISGRGWNELRLDEIQPADKRDVRGASGSDLD